MFMFFLYFIRFVSKVLSNNVVIFTNQYMLHILYLVIFILLWSILVNNINFILQGLSPETLSLERKSLHFLKYCNQSFFYDIEILCLYSMSNSLNNQIILLNQKKYLSISKRDCSRAKFFMSKKVSNNFNYRNESERFVFLGLAFL